MNRLVAGCGLVCAFWLALPGVCAAQLMVEGLPRWGFDGKVRVGRFNLLTVEVFNSSDRPWQGNPKLEAATGFGGGDIPVIQQGLYVEPYGRRRLQFLVFTPRVTDYRLSWGRREGEQFLIDEPASTMRLAEVQFAESNPLLSSLADMPRFDDADFPPSAAGLETLAVVNLDHVPGWNDAQNRAFLDWLSAGGTLHLYQGSGGTNPAFRGTLSVLNEPSDNFPIGAGQVVRHAAGIQTAEVPEKEAAESNNRYRMWEPTRSSLELLKMMTQPDHNWGVIYLMTIAYLLLIFPGCWLLGRKKGDYRITYGAILGIVLLFSVGFRTVGARGYGENTSVHSVALAQPASGNRALLTQWSSLFVTGGGEYEIKHQTEGTVYSSGQLDERIPGFVLNRPVSLMMTDIASFSARTFIQAGVLSSLPLAPKILKFEQEEGNGSLKSLQLKSLELEFADDSLWKDDGLFRGVVLAGDRIYVLQPQGNSLVAATGGQSLKEVINQSDWTVGRYAFSNQTRTPPQLFESLRGPLIAYDLNLGSDEDVDSFVLPRGQAKAYLYVRLPDNARLEGDRFTQQSGRMLYVLPIREQ
ncbi:hypothetical protein [Planctomicrobium piriforme]|uniref:Uncharacterized protein n=1 Tax=Planctomicrobium piriforme TaxID=1576369 RepID=A0A1I3NGZ5_9PLAN|nr:hypothetical protein [Planctomicrobium piriforme]SFJ08521.1 hypothetical protein SAMN05421753_11596 [Planctomicrobium piriforme]